MFISIDPGNDLGWAIWNAKGLIACGLGDPRACVKHVVSSIEPDADVIHDAWIEDQVIYPRSPVPPQDILTLARGAHRVAGRYDACGIAVHFVKPADWKGQVPCTCEKAKSFVACTHHSRVWGALNASEQETVNKALLGMTPKKWHNVFDAIGLGQWVRSIGLALQLHQ